jgi:Mediator of CRAC channel activity
MFARLASGRTKLPFRQRRRVWREEDLEQRTLDSARVLWSRYAEGNQREVEEHAGRLQSTSELAALLAGFAVVAFFDLNFTATNTPTVWMFCLTTAVVVRSHQGCPACVPCFG